MAKKSHKIILLLSLLLTVNSCDRNPDSEVKKQSKHIKKNEHYYQKQWCTGKGKIEYHLTNNTRVDCLTPTHAIEFDWASKWYESVGQSLYYSLQTNKRAGIVLIIKHKKDYKYWLRLNSTIKHFQLPIDTWLIKGF